MFRHPFSFEGRIGRKEYGLTIACYFAINYIIAEIDGHAGSGWPLLLLIPELWIVFAQSAKRCHDLNKSAVYLFIPFYFFWLLFQKGSPTINQYGQPNSHPKDGDVISIDDEIQSIGERI